MKTFGFRASALLTVGLCAGWALCASQSRAAVPGLDAWSITGRAVSDAEVPGPDGKVAIRIDANSRATIPLRTADGSGRVVMQVRDDGFVGSPGGAKAAGPRWGLRQADGRVLVVGLMYARYLHADGSLCVIDTQPDAAGAWNTMSFVSPRRPGWSKWEFRYDAQKGLTILVNDEPLPSRYFDWNKSRSSGFNGIVFFGDESPAGRALHVAGIEAELGGPMQARPDPENIVRTFREEALAKVEAEAKKKAAKAAAAKPAIPREKWTGGFPGPTLADDIGLPQAPVLAGYADARPRLLFSAADREALRRKAREHPELWNAVLDTAGRIANPASVPTPEAVMQGRAYHRIAWVHATVLAWFVTGEPSYRDGAIRWMVAHCREPVWGTDFRPNLDLQASWYLYYLSIAYDVLHAELSEADAAIVRAGLASHAKALFDDFDPENMADKIRYDQNHTYTPVVALIAASLALLDEEPAAASWLERARAVLRRSRHVLSEDGYYYEGIGYWVYSLHWHVRGAELLGRATGERLMDLPALRDTWRFALHLSLPGKTGAFDIGDSAIWGGDHQRPEIPVRNWAMLWAIAGATGSRESRAAGDFYAARGVDRDAPASSLLWLAAEPAARPLAEIAPYHHFKDTGVVAWRSGWDENATALHFRCGPPLGHAAAAKFGQLQDWTMNAGHVHPDIGAFHLYAKNAYLVAGTGYTAQKWTRDHNTLLIDGKGQGMDGAYHNDRGVPYAQFDGARIEKTYLSSDYAFVVGEFGSAYARQVKNAELRRALLATRGWTLVIDELRMRDDTPRRLTWLCHSDAAFAPEAGGVGRAQVSRQPRAALAVLPLAPAVSALEIKAEETVVMAGTAPSKGALARHGHHLSLTNTEPAARVRFVNLLVPLAAGEKAPVVEAFSDGEDGRVSFTILFADGRAETVRLDLNWSESGGSGRGPAEIVAASVRSRE